MNTDPEGLRAINFSITSWTAYQKEMEAKYLNSAILAEFINEADDFRIKLQESMSVPQQTHKQLVSDFFLKV